ncbi:hypothetical protein [Helicobacter aurati]|uniref:hypothetical protein n=1 Tax=Helicobacter aurati TaxID=137778 RepID=UPI0011C07F61|nr:hypothetical protein [Helicobacter aurati]
MSFSTYHLFSEKDSKPCHVLGFMPEGSQSIESLKDSNRDTSQAFSMTGDKESKKMFHLFHKLNMTK